MTNVFDLINSMNEKKYLADDQEAMREYKPFLVNKGMSLFAETIMYSSEMNMHPSLTEKMQYDYYFYSTRKGKRWSKWPKKLEQSPDIELIKFFYKYNDKRAEEALSLLTEDQLKKLRSMSEKGGFTNELDKKPRGGKTK